MTLVEPLSAPLELSFDYTRSLGPVLGRFMSALAVRQIVGVRGSDGRVHVPPVEYDPVTAAPLAEFVDVSDEGDVLSWTWSPRPLEGQPIDRPFAWALIRLDGADIAFLHIVLGCAADEVRMGMRIEAVWRPRDEWGPTLQNIDHFRPTDEPDAPY